jgi:hypothetical protein
MHTKGRRIEMLDNPGRIVIPKKKERKTKTNRFVVEYCTKCSYRKDSIYVKV